MEIKVGQLVCKKNGKPFTSGKHEGIVSEIKIHTHLDFTSTYVFLQDGSFTPLLSVCDKVEMDNILSINYIGRKNRKKKLCKNSEIKNPRKVYQIIKEFPIIINEFTQNHRRLKHFQSKGYKCSCCGIEGVKFGITLDGAFKNSGIINTLKQFTRDFTTFCEIFKSEDKNGLKKFPGIKIDVYTNDNQLMTIDHIIPISKGGKWENSNIDILCQFCNNLKSDKL